MQFFPNYLITVTCHLARIPRIQEVIGSEVAWIESFGLTSPPFLDESILELLMFVAMPDFDYSVFGPQHVFKL